MKILMVCLGNICRSPLAEGIMQKRANELNLDIYVDSAGTSAWHEGEKPDRRSIEIANKYGVDISKQRSRPFTAADFDEFDYIFAMDLSNYSDIIAQARNEHETKKVHLLLSYAQMNTNEVPDPYYGGVNGFETVYKMINEACERVLKTLAV